MEGKPSTGKPRPAMFRALGRKDPPQVVETDGQRYERVELLKHDSWAATAIYQGPRGKIVCKFNRLEPIFGISMAWLGRWLAEREAAHYRRLTGLPTVPRLCGPIHAGGKRLLNAVAHQYVEGHPLRSHERVNERFFPELTRTMEEMHRRGLAYVDLHKRENIIVGRDGKPYLVDFQVSFMTPADPLKRSSLGRWLLDHLQAGDRYHLLKHKVHHRPDQYGSTIQTETQRPWWIRLHRVIGQPLRECRRRLLVLCGIRTTRGRAQSEHFAEDAVRQEKRAA
jgi:hypothetical protein